MGSYLSVRSDPTAIIHSVQAVCAAADGGHVFAGAARSRPDWRLVSWCVIQRAVRGRQWDRWPGRSQQQWAQSGGNWVGWGMHCVQWVHLHVNCWTSNDPPTHVVTLNCVTHDVLTMEQHADIRVQNMDKEAAKVMSTTLKVLVCSGWKKIVLFWKSKT